MGASDGMEAFLVSLFTAELGCCAWAGGVEVLVFFLFLVVFPARHISRVFPRFYFRTHSFCFLLLVAILESRNLGFSKWREARFVPNRPILFQIGLLLN
jgi:uncharacterized membrane protein YoaK (UPF0700 family)